MDERMKSERFSSGFDLANAVDVQWEAKVFDHAGVPECTAIYWYIPGDRQINSSLDGKWSNRAQLTMNSDLAHFGLTCQCVTRQPQMCLFLYGTHCDFWSRKVLF